MIVRGADALRLDSDSARARHRATAPVRHRSVPAFFAV